MIQQNGIIKLQQRMREIGRIRLGVKGPKGEPKKITTIRFTSHDKHVVEVAAKTYGGSVVACDAKASPDLKGQWEVVTDASEIAIFPSPMPVSVFMETWSGGGCTRRCDGCTELLSGSSCMCDPDAPECKPTTRLNVICPDLPGIGTFRLETHGWNAAAELTQSYDWLKSMAGNGRIIEARLGVEERTSKKEGKTQRFMVPCIRIQQTPRELMAGAGQQVLGPGDAQQLPTGSPVTQPLTGRSAPQLPPPTVHETPAHVLKDANPRGGVFALLKDMELPEHDGKAKELYYMVFGRVLKTPITSLSKLTEDEWRTLWAWLLRVKDSKAVIPRDFTDWIAGKHALQQHDPMAGMDATVPGEKPDPFKDPQPA